MATPLKKIYKFLLIFSALFVAFLWYIGALGYSPRKPLSGLGYHTSDIESITIYGKPRSAVWNKPVYTTSSVSDVKVVTDFFKNLEVDSHKELLGYSPRYKDYIEIGFISVIHSDSESIYKIKYHGKGCIEVSNIDPSGVSSSVTYWYVRSDEPIEFLVSSIPFHHL